jgi:tryptophan halogenase
MTKNISILGGGTVGWLTALMTKEHYPLYDVTLIENSEIGVLGAGEGTVPNILDIFDTIRIPLSDLIRECSATIKIGNKFSNWCGDSSSYFLPFDISHPNLSYSSKVQLTHIPYPFITTCITNNQSLDNVFVTAKLAEQNKVPYFYTPKDNATNPLGNFTNIASVALHLDSRKLAVYLRKIAEDRGITRIDGNYVSATLSEQGNITQLTLEDGKQIQTDFVFDCSGFARLLIGKLFKTEWISYSKYFPQNTAVPFFIPHNNTNVKSYTQSRGMKYGWMWQVDVQDRSGCGYVFDSTLITPEQALSEVEELLGHSVTSPKTFTFNAGTYKTSIVNNCMAMGLSSGFIEPLEATAIWQNMTMLTEFLMNDGINNYNNMQFLKSFNKFYDQMNLEILEFIQGHYVTPRADTEFWKKIRYDVPLLPSLQEKIEYVKAYNLIGIKNDDRHIGANTWLIMAAGQQILNVDKIKQHQTVKSRHPHFENAFTDLKRNIEESTNHCVTHDYFLQKMREVK